MGGPIWIKFNILVQNDMSTAVIWSQSKPEVEIQYGGFLANSMACHPSATLFSEVARRLWLSSLVLCLKVLFWGRVYFLYTSDLADVVKAHNVNLQSYADDSQLYLRCQRQHMTTAGQRLEMCIYYRCEPLDGSKQTQVER